MIKTILPAEKYDSTYVNEDRWNPVIIGCMALIVWFVVDYDHLMESNTWYLVTVPFRFFCVVWVRKLADEKNMDKMLNGVAAFVFPAVTLIWMGYCKKLNFRFKINTEYAPETQLKELRKYADSYSRRKRYAEARFVYQYIVDNLTHDDEDVSILNELTRISDGKIEKEVVME